MFQFLTVHTEVAKIVSIPNDTFIITKHEFKCCMQFIAMQYIQPVFKQQRLFKSSSSRLYKINPML